MLRQGPAQASVPASVIQECHQAQPCGPHFTHFITCASASRGAGPARRLQSLHWCALAFPGPGKTSALDCTCPCQLLQPFTTPSCLILTEAGGKGRVHYTDGETEAGDATASLSHCLAPSTVALQARGSLLALNKTLRDPKLHGYRKETGE